jgi:DNA polymerase-3 subunit gamma/tau
MMAPKPKKSSEPDGACEPEAASERRLAREPKVARESSGYVVLARRYRPAQLGEVVGQGHVTRTLENAIRADRVHHAYLFTGSRGVGKTTVARILAKALNCDTGATPTPCDRCTSCLEITRGMSVDVQEIDGASHTGVDDVREIRESVRYQPARCRKKIYIIDEVHMLSTSAFNALLKTLEEPPPHVVFIFATTEPHKIPATILSRCQRFDFKRVPDPVMVKHLGALCEREGLEMDRSGLALIARASEGSVRDALSLLDQVVAYASGDAAISAARVAEVLGVADRRVLFDLSRAVLARDPREGLGIVDRLFEGGQDLSQFAQAFLAHLRDLVVVRTCTDPAPLLDVTETELAELEAQAKGEGAEIVPQLFDLFARTAEEIARSSVPRLLLEMAIIEMVHLEPLLPLGDLLERLERLEGRLSGTARGGAAPPPPGPPRFSSGVGERTRSVKGGPRAKPAAPSAVSPSAESVAPAPAPVPAPAQPVLEGSPREGLQAPRAGNGGAMERWQELLHRVEERQPMAASAFVPGRLLEWSGERIVLGYPPGSFELQRARDAEKRRVFEEECGAVFGQPLSVQIREMNAAETASPEAVQMSVAEARERQHAEQTRRLREEAREHPVTRGMVEKFGAVIDSITTEAEKP